MFKSHYLPVLISQISILPAALIGAVRFRRIPSLYHPFIYLCWAGLAAEVVSLLSTYLYHSNAISSNIYVLAEFLLILWLFKNWGIFQGNKKYFWLSLTILPLIWVLDSVILHPITRFSSIYRMAYSLLIVIFSIYYINELFFVEKRSILKNSRFLISMAFLVYFSFKGLFEIYFLFHLQQMKTLFRISMMLVDVVNELANFTFAVAMLWIPRKNIFFTP